VRPVRTSNAVADVPTSREKSGRRTSKVEAEVARRKIVRTPGLKAENFLAVRLTASNDYRKSESQRLKRPCYYF
jgi:hypothetical protein